MIKETYEQLLDKLHHATDYLQDVAGVLNELLGECDAADDIAAWKRSKFVLSKNDDAPMRAAEEKKEEEKGVFEITKKEIEKMSKVLKGKFFVNGFAVCWRRRQTGKNSHSYQVRFQRGIFNIQFTEKRKDDLKPRFLEELKKQIKNPPDKRKKKQNGVPTTFTKFAEYYFENFRKLKVGERTFQGDMGRFYRHIEPYFKEKRIEDITPLECQTLLNQIKASGKGKTADEVCCLLNIIFKFAVRHHLIQWSPMDSVFLIKHERQHGSALTKEEEAQLLEAYKGTMYELPFAIALYTGMRPNEYDSARIEGEIIVAVNSKRKNRKLVYKRIAISPMLRPYLVGVTELTFPRPETMREKIKAVLPNHKLYDLRTTFNTRCKECGVADPARMEFMGHSLGELGEAYTDLSTEYLVREGAKLLY